MWKLWLILEHFYGGKESLEKLYKESIRVNNSFAIFKLMIKIYKEQHKWKFVEKMYYSIISEFPQKINVWLDFYKFYYLKINCPKRCKSLQKNILYRSTGYMSKFQQIGFKARLGKVEFFLKHFDIGRKKFESLLQNNPKRFDVLIIYLDMELKYSSDLELIRRLFSRSIQMGYSYSKMQILFKKFLCFEKSLGIQNQIRKIIKKAKKHLLKRI